MGIIKYFRNRVKKKREIKLEQEIQRQREVLKAIREKEIQKKERIERERQERIRERRERLIEEERRRVRQENRIKDLRERRRLNRERIGRITENNAEPLSKRELKLGIGNNTKKIINGFDKETTNILQDHVKEYYIVGIISEYVNKIYKCLYCQAIKHENAMMFYNRGNNDIVTMCLRCDYKSTW